MRNLFSKYERIILQYEHIWSFPAAFFFKKVIIFSSKMTKQKENVFSLKLVGDDINLLFVRVKGVHRILLHMVEYFIFRNSDFICTGSLYTKYYLQAKLELKDKLVWLPNGVFPIKSTSLDNKLQMNKDKVEMVLSVLCFFIRTF